MEEVTASRILTDPESVALCVARDFSGEFEISITREDDVDAAPLILQVEV